MPPLGNYSLHIAPAAAIATANKTMMQNTPALLAISMAVVVRLYYTAHIARWGRSMAFIKASKCRHQTRTRSDRINRTSQCREFTISQVPEMALSSWIAKKFIKGMTYQWKAKDMVNAWEDLYGAADIVI